MVTPPLALRRLLAGAVDYAGLFPPAALSMPETLVRYGTYLLSPHAWALGRLVLPAARLSDLRKIIDPGPTDRRWDLSILLGTDVEADVRRARELAGEGRGLHVAALEASVAGVHSIAALAAHVKDAGVPVYVELPIDADPAPALEAVRAAGLRAKARTGGVTAEAIPPSAAVVSFLEGCFRAGLAFKLTAGLHHAVRGSHPLTYEPGSACAAMHGFLNVFVASALLAGGAAAETVAPILDEADTAAFRFDDDGLSWRGHRADLAAVGRARAGLASFGSCSFDEPIRELQALGLV